MEESKWMVVVIDDEGFPAVVHICDDKEEARKVAKSSWFKPENKARLQQIFLEQD